jgi:hypothetical protein
MIAWLICQVNLRGLLTSPPLIPPLLPKERGEIKEKRGFTPLRHLFISSELVVESVTR